MAMLSEKDAKFLKDYLAKALVAPVKLLFFTQTIACQFCKETEQLLREVAELSDKIGLQVYDFIANKDAAEQYGVDKIPGTVVMGAVDYGIRFYGIPSGYEFTTLIEDIVDVSRGKSGLSPQSLEWVQKITAPVHIQVFVTPT